MRFLKHSIGRPHALLLFFLLVVCLPQTGLAAAAETATTASVALTPELLNSRIEATEKLADLEGNTKTALLDLYRKSLEHLKTAATNDTLADEYVRAIETAPTESKKNREERDRLAQPSAAVDQEAEAWRTMSLAALEQSLLKAKANAATMEAKVATLSRQLADQNERPAKASQRLAELKKMESDFLDVSKQSPPSEQLPQLREAWMWERQTQLQALQSEIKKLQQELVSMPVLVELATAQREAAGAQLEQANAQAQLLENTVNQRRQAEAAQRMGQAEEAIRQVADSSPVLQQAAAVNASLGEELQRATSALERVTSEKEKLGKELKATDEKYTKVKQQYELAGWNQAVGLMLEDQRRSLPDLRLLQKKMGANETAIAETGLRQVQHDEEQKRLENIEAYAAQLAAGFPQADAESELIELLASRRELLGKIMGLNQTVLGVRAETDVLYRQLVDLVTTFRSYLAERMLWVRSTPLMQWADFSLLPGEVKAFFGQKQWVATATALLAHIVVSPMLLFACLVTGILRGSKKWLLGRLETVVNRAINPTTYDFGLPVQAVILTMLLALPWPLLLLTLSWGVQAMPESTEFSRAIAFSLSAIGHRLFLLAWVRRLLLPQSLAVHFFHWPKSVVTSLQRGIGVMLYGFLPMVFLTQVAFNANYHAGGSFTLGRLMLIVAIGILAFAFYLMFHPRIGVWHGALRTHAHRLSARLYPFVFFLIMLLPLVFSGVVIAGFVVAVGSLLRCLFNSLWVVVVVVVMHRLIEQWLVQSSRRLALRSESKPHRKTVMGEEAGRQPAEPDGGPAAEPEVDLVELSADSRKLLDAVALLAGGFGLWWVWAEVLPALKIFNELILWKYPVVVDGQKTLMPVTLADAGLSLLIGIVTLMAVRRFPALLNIVLLQHLDLSPGSRYTATTLSRYGIGGIGLLLVSNTLGFRWEQIQWLVAALGVGIGFGLQEIVANFISGLILLFERPIRVGDVVTVGGTDGVVTRIRIRATTIRDFDGKELLVPNKEFISGHLLNWSLSDPITRIMVPVGLAYGSDVQLAMNQMIAAAREHPEVLDDPRPTVTFDSFGDNALLLTLRCFIGSVDNRTAIKSDLHLAIDGKFRAASLSMAFPQRDVHLDTPAPLAVRIVREEQPQRNGSSSPAPEG